MTRLPRIAGLDVVRGTAIGLVILHHALPSMIPGAGVVGVVMFFTLSGYLITGLLLEELAKTGGLRLGHFYARRAARLVPALVTLVLVVILVTLTLDPLHDRDLLLPTVLAALTWSGDLPHVTTSAATFHLWTLALEEQFYLVWPSFLLVASRRGRLLPWLLAAGLLSLAAAAATTAWLWEDPDLAYTLPTSWAGGFVIGALFRACPTSGARLPAIASAIAGLTAACLLPVRGHVTTYVVIAPAIAALTGVTLTRASRTPVVVTVAARRLAQLGELSYAAYLWNYPLTLWLGPALGRFAVVIVPSMTIILAWVSHRRIERPVLRWARLRLRPAAASAVA
jgi:peptidoglycan/LPS O-acetylase OafA/YrhL